MKLSLSRQHFSYQTVSKLIWILFFSFAITGFAKADHYIDTSKKKLLAAVYTNDEAGFVTLEANVVYPEVLTGNEEETRAYIEKFSVNRRAYLIRTFNRSKNYFPKVTAVLKKYNLPQELKVLLALESAFNGNAVSKAGAVGYWQIMDEVAKEYGLKYVPKQPVTKKKTSKNKLAAKVVKKSAKVADDRKNFNKSTYAAARYLKDRSRNLDNNLLLMVASYNCGIGNVWEAMKKTGKTEPDFWDVKSWLPAETQAYVMNFISLNVIFHNYDKFTNDILIFTPVKVKMDTVEGTMTGELPDSGIQDLF